MNNYLDVLIKLENLRQRKVDGKLNCIPWGLPRFEIISPGLQQAKYIIITANSKIGKSQFTDWLLMYNIIRTIYEKKLPVKLQIKYFSLEMSSEQKAIQMFCNLLYFKSKGKIRIAPTDLKSTRLAVEKVFLDNLTEYKPYLDFFNNHVTYIDNIRTADGIYNYMKKYAKENGIIRKKIIEIYGKKIEVYDKYIANNKEEYLVPIVDHGGLLHVPKGSTDRIELGVLSHNFIKLRNDYNQTPILINQQAAAQEGIENFKLNKTKPSLDGLGINKTIQQDADMVLGLYSPYRYGIKNYLGYDISTFKDSIRFVEILADRDGGANNICPLYFDGAVNYFKELPKYDNTEELKKYENRALQIQQLNSKVK